MQSHAARLACLDTPALPLQLLLRRRPEWRQDPVVVVQDDRPTAPIMWVNKMARKLSIRAGMRFAEARALAATVRADVVPQAEITDGIDALYETLLRFTPYVEPDAMRPGLFWLDPRGLSGLYASLQEWGNAVHVAVRAAGFTAALVIGFNRFNMFALARTRAGVLVAQDASEEASRAANVPLAQLDWSPTLLHTLSTLGIKHVRSFVELPASDMRQRFGAEAEALHRLAHDKQWAPLIPRMPVARLEQAVQIEPAAIDHGQLLFAIKGALHRLLQALDERCEALTKLYVHFDLEHAPARHEELVPASATLDAMLILELMRLRLANMQLPQPVEQITLTCEAQRISPSQLVLLQSRPRRDPVAAAQAIARLRAAFGDTAVTRARLCGAHLPEASYIWEPALELAQPSITPMQEELPLMRQVLARPEPIAERDRAAMRCLAGPFRVSGAWWVRTVERDYYYHSRGDEIVWIYYDRPRRRWFLHGIVD